MRFYDLPPVIAEDARPLNLATCGECCAVIADDDERANRRQHAQWHATIASELYDVRAAVDRP